MLIEGYLNWSLDSGLEEACRTAATKKRYLIRDATGKVYERSSGQGLDYQSL